MKIKRFFAQDIRQAMRMVKEELGADAVIMSNRSVENGVEIVAARDFDEQLVHDQVQQQARADQTSVVNKKTVMLPDFKQQNHRHVVSSQRKRQADGSIPELPVRKKMQQYKGYAEKVALGSARRENKRQGNAADVPERALINTVNAASKTPEKVVLGEQLLLEMRNEMNELKAAMKQRLAEVKLLPQAQIPAMKLDLLRRLAEMGIAKQLAMKIANQFAGLDNMQTAWRQSLTELQNLLPLAQENLLEQGGIVALVGPTGVGKTTSIAKLAAKYSLSYGANQVALLTLDNYRIAAHEHLKTYGRILDVPVAVIANKEDLHTQLKRFSDRCLILIDTAGMSQRNMQLKEQIEILQQCDFPVKSYLVMAATTQFQAMNEIISAFQVFQPQASILTKLDEAALKGPAVSALIKQQLPLAFMADGQQVPEDLHKADAQQLIKLCNAELDTETDYNDGVNDEWTAAGYAAAI